jgi:hypothetical protein
MPQCNKCGKKGLFLKIEEDSGLCLSCNEEFAGAGKALTEKITAAKNKATVAKDPAVVAENARVIERLGNELIELHRRYHLKPSQELLDLIATYRKMAELAANQTAGD